MKIALITHNSSPESAGTRMLAMFSQLESMNVDYDRFRLETAPLNTKLNEEYDAIIYLRPTTSMKSITDSVDISIPVFLIEATSIGATQISSSPGVTGAASSTADRFFDVMWTSSNWTCYFGKTWALSGGTSLYTVSPTNPKNRCSTV